MFIIIIAEYVLTVEELRGLNEALVTAKPKGEYDSLVSDLCSCIGRAIFPQRTKKRTRGEERG